MYSLTWLQVLEDINELLQGRQTRAEMRKFAIIVGVASISFCFAISFLDLLAPCYPCIFLHF